MRFPLAAMYFIIIGFIFLAIWGVSSYMISQFGLALDPFVEEINESGLNDLMTTIPYAFGIICVLFFVVGIVLFFILDANAEEPELYWRRY